MERHKVKTVKPAGIKRTKDVLAMVSTSLAIFIPAGIIDWTLGLSMMVGGGIGGWVSAHYAQKLGNIWIKYLFSIMVFASAVKILIF